ncbi:hypothetical protein CBR_g50196 [Chara braunii]|uniref:LisH domain-containing protein n=1 Tax=Chara braunii TaxID=69332 RepID=A0A388M693_CHABU|nr:hypothetical protein CBR_g50196 [Chara braunii]|eukprot:GBG90104.1 hypothetical protein CBR_g50196 [Chara braunii]
MIWLFCGWQAARHEYLQLREEQAFKLCLKHLRQCNYDAFAALQKHKGGLQLEDELLAQLHNLLVLQGDDKATERVLRRAGEDGLFEEYVLNSSYKPVWSRVVPEQTDCQRPGMRGGHQMCIDPEEGKIYLIGGWDGEKDLSDFWVFEIATSSWRLLSEDTAQDGGPGPRSCHKVR